MFRRIARSSRMLVVIAALVLPSVVSAQNLVLNPNFDSGPLVNWTATATCATNPATCTVTQDNAEGFTTVPSARLTARDNPGQSLTSDCYAYSGGVTPGGLVDLGVSVRANATDANSQAQVIFLFFSGAPPCDLGGGAVFQGNANVTLLSSSLGWDHMGELGFTIPPASTHFNVLLQVRQNGAAPAFTADYSFDRAFLGPPGTTPVELQSFDVE